MATITKLISDLITFINNTLVPLVFAVAFIVFIVGVFRFFIAGAENPEKRQQGTQFIIYSIIGFAVMISVWGLVNLAVNTFGFDNTARPNLPTFGGSNSSGSSNSPTPPAQNILPPGQYANPNEPQRPDGLPGVY